MSIKTYAVVNTVTSHVNLGLGSLNYYQGKSGTWELAFSMAIGAICFVLACKQWIEYSRQ